MARIPLHLQAWGSRSLLPLTGFLVLLLFTTGTCAVRLSSADMKVLLEFKSKMKWEASDNFIFDTWKATRPNCEDWALVTCNKQGRVETLSLYPTVARSRGSIEGQIPESIGNLTALKQLYLHLNKYYGKIPTSIGNLKALEILDLSNNYFTGAIPASIGNLVALKELSLYSNQLSGGIPASIGKLQKVTSLSLAANKLNATSLPVELGQLKSVLYFDLSDNSFASNIPPAIGNMTSLVSLYMQNGGFRGPIPSTLSNLKGLYELFLQFNSLTGSIPDSLKSLTSLSDLYLNNNKLSGPFPSWLGQLKELRSVELSNNTLTGSLPEAIGGLKNLYFLGASNNKLTGRLPASLGKSTSLTTLDLSNNQLVGSINIPFAARSDSDQLWSLAFSNNYFSGVPKVTVAGKTFCTADGLKLQSNCLDVTAIGACKAKQRSTQACQSFCNALQPLGACGGRGSCMQGKSAKYCLCDKGYKTTTAKPFTCTIA